MFFGTLIKNVHAVGFSGKPDFLERVCFHRAMLFVTNFRIVLGVCIVNAMIFIKKILIKLFWITFYNLVKFIHVINLAMLTKLCLVFFLQNRLKNGKFLKIREHHAERFEKMLSVMFFWFLITKFFLNHFWRKKTSVRFFSWFLS